jgi:RNA polymerase sigma-70 factor (ECF subfamily)
MAVSGGDALAFVHFYERVAPRIYRVAFRTLEDAHQSEEVLQEVLLEVWQNSDRFDPGRGSAVAWLTTLTHNKAVDRVRRTEAGRRRDTLDAERRRPTPFDETASAVHTSLEAQMVRAALSTLSPVQRRALELVYFGGYTHREVSRLTQVPLGTAKTRIRDGLRRLRDMLSARTSDPMEPPATGTDLG